MRYFWISLSVNQASEPKEWWRPIAGDGWGGPLPFVGRGCGNGWLDGDGGGAGDDGCRVIEVPKEDAHA